MSYLKELSSTCLNFLKAQGLGAEELGLIVIFASFFALVVALLASRRTKDIGKVAPISKLNERLGRLQVELGDLRSKLENEQTELRHQLKALSEQIAQQEKNLRQAASSILPPSAPPAAQETREETKEDKKKELSSPALEHRALETLKEPEPAPVKEIAPEVPASPEEIQRVEVVEEPVKTGLLAGLKKTRSALLSKLAAVFGSSAKLDKSTLDTLEEILISSDLGVRTTQKLLSALQAETPESEPLTLERGLGILKKKISEILNQEVQGRPQGEIAPQQVNAGPKVILVVGVNGVGKTTTIGKLAAKFSEQGARVLLGAADTFRAAAGEQIEVWAERAKVELLRGAENAKPSTVAYEAVNKAKAENFDVVIIDTAGRLHTKVNLMNELSGVISIINRELNGAPHETILVVDATTGQNALEQAREFNERANLSGLIVTKLDGTPKGGIVVAIKDELGIPIRYVGVGESVRDLRAFKAEEFVQALLAEDSGTDIFSPEVGKSEIRAVRRRGNGI